MRKGIVFSMLGIGSALVLSNIFLAVQTLSARNELCDYSARTDAAIADFGERMDERGRSFESRLQEMESSVESLSERQSSDAALIKRNLNSIKESADSQFSETVDMKKSYDDMLAEQRKRTVDSVSKDSAVSRMKNEAERSYSDRKFAAAYKGFKNVLSYQPEDMESRLKKAKSLYYMNRSDSSKYPEILGDIKVLKAKGACDDELVGIEAAVEAELGVVHGK